MQVSQPIPILVSDIRLFYYESDSDSDFETQSYSTFTTCDEEDDYEFYQLQLERVQMRYANTCFQLDTQSFELHQLFFPIVYLRAYDLIYASEHQLINRIPNTESYIVDEDIFFNFDFTLQSGTITKYIRNQVLPSSEYCFKLCEDVAILLNGIRRSLSGNSLNKTLLVEYIIIFVKLRSDKSLIKLVSNNNLLEYIENIFKNDNTDPLQLQSFSDNLSMLRTGINTVKETKKSQIYKKLHKIGMYALALSVFDSVGINMDKLGYDKFEQEVIKRKYKFDSDLIFNLMDSLLFLVEKGYQIILTGNVDHIFHSSTTYTALYEDIKDLTLKSKCLANPEAFGFNSSWYGKKLDDTIEKTKNVIRFAYEMDSFEKKYLEKHLNDLEMIKISQITVSSAQETRKAPFSILLFAGSGVGKSSLSKLIFHQVGKTLNLPTDDYFLFPLNPTAKYFDNFKTNMWAILIDEIAFQIPGKNPTGDPTTHTFIQLNNNAPLVPDQAAIEDKGKIPAKPKLLIGTTNVKDMNAYHYFSCPSAVQRRFPFIVTVAVKPEYQRDDGSGMLDSFKAITPAGEYADFWILTVEKVYPNAVLGGMAKMEVVFTTDDIYTFTTWLSKEVILHEQNQDNMMNFIGGLQDIKICSTCYKPQPRCCCSLQSSQEESLFILFCNLFLEILMWILRVFITKLSHTLYYMCINFIMKKSNDYYRNKIHINIMSNFGNRINKSIKQPKLFKQLVAVLSASYIIKKVFDIFRSNFKDETQTMSLQEECTEYTQPESLPKEPITIVEPLEFERSNPWQTSDFSLNNIDLSPSIISAKGMTQIDFINKLKSNVSYFTIKQNNVTLYGNMLCIKGNIYITNNHFLMNFNDMDIITMTIINNLKGDGVNTEISFTKYMRDFIKYETHDICSFTINHLPPGKDITKYFASKKVQTICEGDLIMRRRSGEIYLEPVSLVHIRKTQLPFLPTFTNYFTSGRVKNITKSGDCGSPLILHSPRGPFIASIHMAGNENNTCVGSFLYNEFIEEMITKYDMMYQIQQGAPFLLKDHEHPNPLYHKSVFNFIDAGSASIYGSIKGFRPSRKSRVEHTIMSEFFKKSGYKCNMTKPSFDWKPWRLAALDSVEPVTNIDEKLLEVCVDMFYNKIKRQIKESEIKSTLHPYDTFVALNGAEGIAYVDRINTKTSAGYPHYCSKQNFLNNIAPERGLQDPIQLDDSELHAISAMEAQYSKGERVNPIFVGSLKDEPLSLEKAKMGKVRVFGSAPMRWTIIQRKLFLSSIRLIQNRKLIFETAVGTITQSAEWSLLYNHLTRFGKHTCIAGDFRKFDKKMSPLFIRQAYEIIIRLCIDSGNFTSTQILMMRGIACDTAYPWMDFNGDLVEFFGSNPSGHSLTVIINSLVNSLYLRYVYLQLCKQHSVNKDIITCIKEFDSQVNILTYGDDNAINVGKKLPWYNHTNISLAFKEMGIDYTMADKTAASIPFIHISQISFLKRTWRFDKDLNTFVAPLDHDSIIKMLTIWVKSDAVSAKAQCLSVLSSAIREYFYYGKDIFLEKRSLFIDCLISLDMEKEINVIVLPTWEMLCDRFIRSSNDLHIPLDCYMSDNEEECNEEIFSLQFGIVISHNHPHLYKCTNLWAVTKRSKLNQNLV